MATLRQHMRGMCFNGHGELLPIPNMTQVDNMPIQHFIQCCLVGFEPNNRLPGLIAPPAQHLLLFRSF